MKKIELFVVLMMLLATGCGPSLSTPNKENTEVPPISASTPAAATKTVMPATLTPTTTQTPLPPSPTFAPLMSHEQVVEKINTLNRETRSCALPCWWGVIPGKTAWNDVIPIYAGIVGFKLDDNQELKDLAYFRGKQTYFYVTYSIHNRVVDTIIVQPFATHVAYNLHGIMEKYGPPDDIYIRTFPTPYGEVPQLPFYFLLKFSKEKTNFLYVVNGEKNGDNIIGCLSRASDPLIFMWSKNMDPLGGISTQDELNWYKPIGDVSSEDVNAFYKQVMAGEEKICVKTPVTDWYSSGH
jgi:hypothetical protein